MNEETTNKKESIIKKIMKRPKLLKALAVVLAIVLIAGGGYSAAVKQLSKPNHQEKVSEISLKDIGELATQEAYVTVVEAMDDKRNFFFTDIGIPFTESICIFSHDFRIKAGYDFSDIVPIVTEGENGNKGTITIQLPDAKILSNDMLADKEVVYYEKESMFKNLSEQDKADLRAEMGNKATDTALNNGLLEAAKENAKKILENFIYNLYSSDEYVIEFLDIQTD